MSWHPYLQSGGSWRGGTPFPAWCWRGVLVWQISQHCRLKMMHNDIPPSLDLCIPCWGLTTEDTPVIILSQFPPPQYQGLAWLFLAKVSKFHHTHPLPSIRILPGWILRQCRLCLPDCQQQELLLLAQGEWQQKDTVNSLSAWHGKAGASWHRVLSHSTAGKGRGWEWKGMESKAWS